MQKRRSDAETRRMQNLTISDVPAITKNMTARDKLDALSPLSPKASVSTTLDEKNVRVSGYLFSQDSIQLPHLQKSRTKQKNGRSKDVFSNIYPAIKTQRSPASLYRLNQHKKLTFTMSGSA